MRPTGLSLALRGRIPAGGTAQALRGHLSGVVFYTPPEGLQCWRVTAVLLPVARASSVLVAVPTAAAQLVPVPRVTAETC